MTAIDNVGIENYNTIHFEWFLVDWCNFKCTYCNAADKMVERYSKDTSPSKHKLVLQRLSMIDTDFEVDLYGGEPTLHPNFIDILQQLSDMSKCTLIEIKTNLSKPMHFLQQTFVSDKIRLAASYHAQYYDQTFLDKCIAFKDKNFYCHINLSDSPKDWPQILDMIDQFDRHGVKYDLNILLSTPGNIITYNDEFYKIFEPRLKNIADKQTYRFQYSDGREVHVPIFNALKDDMVKFKGYRCKALLYEILSDGTIVNSCTRAPMPIRINKQNACVNVTCPREYCHADFMLNFYKEKQ